MNTILEGSWNPTDSLLSDLLDIKNLIYEPCKLKCSRPIMEPESTEYGACTFILNNLSIQFRIAKITPKKIGQFVTLWKRIGNRAIQPFDVADSIDLFIVSTRKEKHFGQFVFPKSVLCEQGVLSVKENGGKLAIRVYPPWDKTLNRQAQKTQEWQLKYFLDMSSNRPVDIVRAKTLYSLS